MPAESTREWMPVHFGQLYLHHHHTGKPQSGRHPKAPLCVMQVKATPPNLRFPKADPHAEQEALRVLADFVPQDVTRQFRRLRRVIEDTTREAPMVFVKNRMVLLLNRHILVSLRPVTS